MTDQAVTDPVEPGPGPASTARPGATTEDRHPLAGVPVGDWLHAFQHAAVEIFGDEWERRLAEFMAFLRRRLTGDYTVDEYGFDVEVTERFLMTALRPIAEKWFRVEVRGADNIPTTGGALVVSNHSGTVPVDGLMTMLAIHDTTGRFLRPRRVLTGWEPLISGGIEQHMVHGSHDNILQEPRVHQLARLVADAIERSRAPVRVSRA